jgi:CheY-like chemotaxis protein
MRAPVLDLLEVMQFPAREEPEGSRARVLVVADGARRLALRVPGFVGEMALVQEELGPFLNGLRLVTGTAMLDGGRRVVLLNAIQLFEVAAASTAEPAPPPSSESASRPRPTALVVEDSELTRSMLTSTLADAGWRVLEAVNGQVARECFEREEVDVVVTDIEMPVVDGIELTRAIRSGARHPDVPIVVLTTRDDPDSKQLAAEAGADVYLLKASFERDEILETLDRLLAASGQGDSR